MTDLQPESDDRHDSIVVEGDDADHVLPPLELDPFTPEPAPPTERARAALWFVVATIVVVIVAAVIYAIVR